MNVLLKADEAEATDEEEGNGTPCAGDWNRGRGTEDQNDDDSDEFDLRYVFGDPSDDGIAETIAEAEAEAQEEHRDENAQAVADQ